MTDTLSKVAGGLCACCTSYCTFHLAGEALNSLQHSSFPHTSTPHLQAKRIPRDAAADLGFDVELSGGIIGAQDTTIEVRLRLRLRPRPRPPSTAGSFGEVRARGGVHEFNARNATRRGRLVSRTDPGELRTYSFHDCIYLLAHHVISSVRPSSDAHVPATTISYSRSIRPTPIPPRTHLRAD